MLESLLIKVPSSCSPVSIAKLLRTPVLKSICERLLLDDGDFYEKSNMCVADSRDTSLNNQLTSWQG